MIGIIKIIPLDNREILNASQTLFFPALPGPLEDRHSEYGPFPGP